MIVSYSSDVGLTYARSLPVPVVQSSNFKYTFRRVSFEFELSAQSAIKGGCQVGPLRTIQSNTPIFSIFMIFILPHHVYLEKK